MSFVRLLSRNVAFVDGGFIEMGYAEIGILVFAKTELEALNLADRAVHYLCEERIFRCWGGTDYRVPSKFSQQRPFY